MRRITRADAIQFIKFMLCNQTAWLGDLAVFTLLYEVLSASYLLAKAVSYTVGAFISYALNRRFTFHKGAAFWSSTLFRFILVNAVSIGLSLGAMYLATDVLGMPVWVAYFLSIVFSFSNNYLGNRFGVFRVK